MTPVAVATWKHTRAALAEYDRDEADRDRMIEAAETDEAVKAWMQTCDAARERVQQAFYEDCVAQGVPNSRDHCRVVTITYLRRLGLR